MAKLLVLGVDRGPDPRDQTDCYAFVAAALMQAFNRNFPGAVRLINVDMQSDLNSIQGQADFILFVGYTAIWNKIALCLHEIKRRTGFKKIATLSDYSFFLNRDSIVTRPNWAFSFLDDGTPNTTVIHGPFMREYFVNKPKEKIILMDHGWVHKKDTELEWTFRISDWLEPLKDRYKIIRMVRFPEYEMPTIKPHEVVIPALPFVEYLERTDHVESFIVTHLESYGFQVIDMAARGVRMASPVGFIHNTLVSRFRMPLFKNGEELRGIVDAPLEPHWAEMASLCTDYSDVTKIIFSQMNRL